jgi:diguanylate cyclase (GGDEF)-like protein
MGPRHTRLHDSEGLWDWNLVSNRIHYSPRWLALVGCSEEQLTNTRADWLRRVHPDELADLERTLEAQLGSDAQTFELRHRLRHSDGTYRWTLCRVSIERDAERRAVRLQGAHADVTAATVTDELTGLPNGLLLREHLERSIDRAHRYPGFHFAVLGVDLDQASGATSPLPASAEALVTAAARRLETCLRVGDTPSLRHNDLVARVHGDRLVILLDGLKELGHATIVADRILTELLAPFTVRGRETFVAASIGIAVSATGYTSADEVLRDTETALHRARLLGKARCEVFDTAVLQAAQAELRLEADFDSALQRQEFRVVYQPVVSLTSRQVVGFEALVRWEHPGLGTISPLDFIPLAEKSGFILPLGQAILRQACAQLAAWQRLPAAADVWMSVNLSRLQLIPTLVEEIGAAIVEHGIAPKGLVVELTEGTAIENPQAVRSLLMRLRALGIRISIDDFGTGHSSLASLRHFPLDHLKVDRSFVRGIEDSHDMAAILGSVTAMARQLGLHVVAEGIENDAQLAAVCAQGCDFGQGYLFARPLAAVDAAALLRAGTVAGVVAPEVAPASPVRTAPAPAVGKSRDRRWMLAAAAALLIVGLGVSARLNVQPAPAGAGPASALSADAATAPTSPGNTPAPASEVATAPVLAPSAVRQAAPARPANPPPATKRLTALRVEHRHRIGGCRGTLTVSRAGVTFAPDPASSGADDAFSLRYDEFFHQVDDGVMIIRSSARTYRFKAMASDGSNGGDQVQQLLASMATFR